jgi:hypothetical protein
MLKSEAIEALQKSIKESGDGLIDHAETLGICFGERAAVEYAKRDEIVREIIKAKREVRHLGFSMSAVFFKDIWPRARDALLTMS